MSSRAVLLTGVALFVAAATGCAGADSAQAVGTGAKPVLVPQPENTEEGGAVPSGSAGVVPHALGSPLCNASLSTCYPDDPNSARAKMCVLAPDGGPYSASAGYDNAQLACHVLATPLAGPLPACTLAGVLTDSSSTLCSGPTDCAAGFECVAGGKCRHYCCAGECFDPDEFCDIQQTAVDPSIPVPVCMPIHSCGLLDLPSDAGSCGPLQTCAVVRVENGATSCVTVGAANVGEQCDTQRCLSGLTCLGAAGDRHCYKLCHTAPGSTDCTAKQTCRGGLPLFPLPGVGICQ